MRHRKTMEWEKRLKRLFHHIDHHLEDKYGELYSLHPARAPRGYTANPEHDGLFNVGAAFTIGMGSDYGPGYAIEVRMVTLENVPDKMRQQINEEVVTMVKESLPRYFPQNNLNVAFDKNVYKIYGDLKLGEV